MAETVNWKEFVLVKRDGSRVNPEVALKGKHVGLYFGAYWCAPCREFTPKLKQFYDSVKEANNFEVVFVSRDDSIEEMKAYIRESHGDWLHMPFNKDQADALYAKYSRSGGIPDLIIFDAKGLRMAIRGLQEVDECISPPAPVDVLDAWRTKRKDYFQCYREQKNVYAVVALQNLNGFPSNSKMLEPAKGVITNWKQMPLVRKDRYLNAEEALKGKFVGLYFAARWCAPSREFTPKLKQFYDAIKTTENFEIVFVSRDNSADEMNAFMKESHGDWIHTPFDKNMANVLCDKYSRRSSVTDLVIFDEKGERLQVDGCDEVYTWSMRPSAKDVVAVWRTKAAIPRGTAPTGGGTIDWKMFSLGKRDGTRVSPDVALKGKLVGLYFSARRCSDFGLKQFYETLKKTENFEVVFVSDDRSAAEMKANMEETQADWLHIPFSKDTAHALFQKYGRSGGIPDLVLFDAKGNALPINGRNDVFMSAPPPRALVATWRTKRTNYYQYNKYDD